MSVSPTAPVDMRPVAGLVFLLGSDPQRPGELSWPALAALAAADAVLHDGDVAPGTLALVPRNCLVEPAPGDGARARKLAGEGWRVVWLVAGDPAASPQRLAEIEDLAGAGIAIHTISGLPHPGRQIAAPAARDPHSWATALNGLAG